MSEPSSPAETSNLPITKASQQMQVNETGQLALATLDDQLRFAKKLIDDGMVSESFKTPQQLVVGFQYAKALGMSELLAIKMMYVVNGRPCLYSEGPLALAQRSVAFWRIREYFVDEESTEICPANKNLKAAVFGAVTELWRREDVAPSVDFFTLDDLARAKLDIGKYGKKEVWQKWERIMLRYKARALGLRSKFADCIAGIPIAEYDYSFSPETPDIGPTSPVTSNAATDEIIKTFDQPTDA